MRIPHSDEADLEWFLGEGECQFMRSTIGPMLDRAKLMSPRHLRDEQTGKAIADKYDRRAAGGSIDAQPTGGRPIEVTPDGHVRIGNDPNHSVVVRYASISKHLSRVERQSVTLGKVLRVYYGDVGSRWGRTTHGRIFSLYARTPAGAKLVTDIEAKEKSPVFLTDDERLGVIATLQGIPSQSKLKRKRALDMADKQAWQLYRAACRCWSDIASGVQS